jgi:hypothetical protein
MLPGFVFFASLWSSDAEGICGHGGEWVNAIEDPPNYLQTIEMHWLFFRDRLIEPRGICSRLEPDSRLAYGVVAKRAVDHVCLICAHGDRFGTGSNDKKSANNIARSVSRNPSRTAPMLVHPH